MDNHFPKSEKLKQEKVIKQLFSKGKSVYKYPFKLLWLANSQAEEGTNPKVLVSVPKRAFKKAVDRNRIKRQIKEAYRLNKSEWLGELDNKPAYLAIIYVAKEFNESSFITKKLVRVLALMQKK